MGLAPVLVIMAVLIFAGASFFFSLAETSLFSLGSWQARQLAERKPAAGGAVVWFLGRPQDLLAAIALETPSPMPRLWGGAGSVVEAAGLCAAAALAILSFS
jgi:CBS domain containing-hemolysin-like protein